MGRPKKAETPASAEQPVETIPVDPINQTKPLNREHSLNRPSLHQNSEPTARPTATAAAMAREQELGKFIERRLAFGQNRYVCTGCNNYDSYDLRQVQEHVRLTHAAS